MEDPVYDKMEDHIARQNKPNPRSVVSMKKPKPRV